MINFRDLRDMEIAINRSLPRIAGHYAGVIGIPRSGMLAAARIAASLGLPLTDVEGFIDGRWLQCGSRGFANSQQNKLKKFLLVDDSICSGREMERTKEAITVRRPAVVLDTCAVFAAPSVAGKVDIYFDICDLPRMFSWNYMNHSLLESCCVDLDGVLCRDPSPEENDDGARYVKFLRSVEPIVVPKFKIGAVVTARLEKYRHLTETWLRENGFKWGKLYMVELPSAEIRRELGIHAKFKGSIYREQSWASLFIESSVAQAQQIADVSKKPVLCTEDLRIYYPSVQKLVQGVVAKTPIAVQRRLVNFMERAKGLLLQWNRW